MKFLWYLSFILCLVQTYSLPENLIDMVQAPEAGKLWALLIAGSDEWYNYRHQADICHSYQILHNHGIPDEQIVVMMKDDLAQSSSNPTPGIIINHPNGSDVYHGVLHDYTGEDVTPQNFLAVLQGDASAVKGIGSGKVINSGPNDHVFVYFADHGAPGLIAFPESELTAKQLNAAIQKMYSNQQYKKMVLYIEACESGSMFANLLDKNINVFATTAANPSESSYACYYDEQRETYLGDVYSVNWMEDSDKEILTKETLTKQFKIVKKETNTSHVQEYGDLSIGKMHISEFQGSKQADPIVLPKVPLNAVPSRDVPLYIAKQKVMKAKTVEERAELIRKYEKLHRNRVFMTQRVTKLVSALGANINKIWTEHSAIQDFECYDTARKYFSEECFNLSKNEYAYSFMYLLVNLCEHGVTAEQQRQAMINVCTHPPVYNII